ncbi:iron complex outermembrane recepter protein/outer-membrane receptor for ferric coprogen and ferric-rhodotorulic acid [Novosphingobium sp. CF614]|uniref:TonB-dependent siderophore receptor n=1 Tax=Novosphingobium sp. CF614 TaxID=1884364 RepID=UPI0008E2496D|nr:TonB-dependent receptor [Novosphingobium sp. CF614]SFF92268.1 iron complex outermembrane recepter protein/outer-membrane receptor for ferric coprogen and ferric-rhodotorulic acid [Novosphingobium sp. CF614]
MIGPIGRALINRHCGSRIALALAMLAAPMALPATAAAQTEAERSFEIPAGTLGDALRRFAEQSRIQLLYPANIVEQRQSPGVTGHMTAEQALARLLAGTGLVYRFNDATTVTLSEPVSAEDGGRVLGPVMVQGVEGSGLAGATLVNGINGSRDVTATEGTGSFTSNALTVGSKTPVPLKDVPQSLSVLTAQAIEEQAITDLTEALSRSTGVTLVQGQTSNETLFYSRGFQITSIQIDGGAPLNGRQDAFGYYPQIDMAQYDHVELLRGAAGTFNLYGDPSGTINLTRKKPLDHPQFVFEGQLGSWQKYRVVADATAPLALDGALRGRAVMSYQDNDYFYRLAHDNRLMLYGIAELDATDTTLITAGISYTRQNGRPWVGGLPRYADGTDARLPRDTAFVFPWNRFDLRTTELFGSIEQKIGEDWDAKLNVTHVSQRSAQKLGQAYGLINPYTLDGVTMSAYQLEDGTEQTSAEFTFGGKFRLFGQDQRVLVGANYMDADGSFKREHTALIAGTFDQPYTPYLGGPSYYIGSPDGSAPPIDVFNFDPSDPRYIEPPSTLLSYAYPERRQVTIGAYVNLMLTPLDRVHLNVGWRYSRFLSRKLAESYCTDPYDFFCDGLAIGDVSDSNFERLKNENFAWPPSASLLYDLTSNLTVYAGYTDIYQNQSYYVDRDLNSLPPITGGNYEVGTKWQSPNKKLNASVSVYYIEKNGIAIPDPNSYLVNPDGTINPNVQVDNKGNQYFFGLIGEGVSCCYVGGADASFISKGVDVEIAGEVLANWQVSLGYTYNDNYYRGKDLATTLYKAAGSPLVSEQPKHLFKFWTSYRLGEGRLWKSLTLGLGVQAQSSVYRNGSTCTQLLPPDDTGYSACAVPLSLIRYTQPGFAIVSGRIDYGISENWSLALNIDNILDKTYYQTIGPATTTATSNWYGEPRNVTLTVRAKW